jgi:hypothetical protein
MESSLTLDATHGAPNVPSLLPPAVLPLSSFRSFAELEHRLERIPVLQDSADIAVFAVEGELTQDLPLGATLNEIAPSQDAYFLGFPFGIGLNLAKPTLPFVKRATVSGIYHDGDGTKFLLLDAINNQGFSGGPVFIAG